ncbi:DNA cytosine methyltransferase [Billgrantia tianxiuensis]|uniref:DNA cytosine methyltransferase n=1 Tax=Billgrantia tianxiuensis TaxID=2497861 RepID=UPI001F2E078A|nr:DNA cytosine methyltransferase [Halomonas tianxiuensis]
MIETREVRHFHLFCGLGAGAKGFNRGHARVGSMEARFRCIGGVDVDPAAIADFGRLTGTPGTVLDMFDRDQYRAFHGTEPPVGWREATPADIQAAAGNERPHIIFLSAPCKGFSGLLSQSRSTTPKYQALNRLTLRGMWLALEAFADDPPELFVFENVPRIANRGRPLLDKIVAMLEHYGYHVAETTHDCGELGNLAQSRKRFLLVARHAEKVPPFLYEPVKRPLRAVGEILGDMPLPGDELAGPMHRVPRLQWKTWVRLAFVEAGSDWRSLNKLAVQDGHLRDYLIVPEYHSGFMGVNAWEESMGAVAGRSGPTNGAFSVADPRFDQSAHWNHGQAYGVRRWSDTTGAVTGQQSPGQGQFSVADPRPTGVRHNNVFRVAPWSEHSPRLPPEPGPPLAAWPWPTLVAAPLPASTA